MTDRLAVIKARRPSATFGQASPDMDWLIAEVERLERINETNLEGWLQNVTRLQRKAERLKLLRKSDRAATLERAAVLVGVVTEVEGKHIRTTIAAAIRKEIKT